MILSKRLAAIAALIPKGDRVADIGTDHGYIPVWLVENGISPLVIASDVRELPLRKAKSNAHSAGVGDKISFVLADGLSGCDEASVDTVIIAGMGGETIINILAAAPWAKNKHLLLQPQTKLRELRAWLDENGYAVKNACLAYDNGRVYVIWEVSGGEEPARSPEEYYVHSTLLGKDPELLEMYLCKLIKELGIRIAGLERSASPDEAELEFCREALTGLQRIRKENENAKGK